MAASSQRTYVRVGDLQEAHRYGLWPWKEVQDILGGETCADAKRGYVKRCIMCKVKADTATYIPQTRGQAASIYAGIKKMIDLNAQHNAFHRDVKASVQTLMGLRQDETWKTAGVKLLKDWGYIDVPRKHWDKVRAIPNHYQVLSVEVLGQEPEPQTLFAVRHDSGNGIYKWVMKGK